MEEELKITAAGKEERYRELVPQVKALIEGEKDVIANLANICAALKTTMNFFWVGFYLVKNNELVLGPFQGPIACTRIQKGKGVCGKAWQDQKSIIVDDVEKFDGHIACSSLSQSEIVIPVFDENKKIVAVLDVDSDSLNAFDKVDEKYLEEIISSVKF